MRAGIPVKVCGLRTIEEALLACEAGAAAIGLLMYPASPRGIDFETARAIAAALPDHVARVGVFVNEAPARVRSLAEGAGLDLVQLAGDEPPADVLAIGLPVLKSLRLRSEADLEAARRYVGVRGLLVDASVRGAYGGTGHTADWGLARRLVAESALPVVLAGGLTSERLAEAVAAVGPAAVDVASGVESAPGRKDPGKVRALLDAAARLPRGPLGAGIFERRSR